MNKLESTVLRQQVRAQQELILRPDEAVRIFKDIEGEILTLDGLPELTEEIIAESKACAEEYVGRPRSKYNHTGTGRLLSMTLAQDSDPRTTKRLLVPNQGYTGGIIVNSDGSQGVGIFGFGNLDTLDNDPIQQAMGDVFYPAMMWVKAIRAELGRGIVSNPLGLDVHQQLADLGLSQGSEYESGNLIGATGKMPSEKGWATLNSAPDLAEHTSEELIKAYGGSGWGDFVTVNPFGAYHPIEMARDIIHRGGSLN